MSLQIGTLSLGFRYIIWNIYKVHMIIWKSSLHIQVA